MPALAPPVPDERAALVAYLVQQQDAFRAVVHGLTDEQAGFTHPPSTITLGALVKHVTWVQSGWLDQALHAPEPVPPGDEDLGAAREHAWTWLPEDSLPTALAAYDVVCRRVLDAVGTLDLDTPVPVPPAPWYPKDVASWTVRWVWFHLLEELARHAGHADLIREAVDGATMYELIAGREGWPETPWLRPWRPATP